MGDSIDHSGFLLSKWYLDCVSPGGDAFIGYAATLRFRSLLLHYSSALRHRHGQATEVTTSLKQFSVPVDHGPGSIRWSSGPLRVDGAWEGTAPPVERILFESAVGSVHWRCLQPRARCELALGKEERLEGLGYVEHLTLSIPPWRLPIEKLGWGRFLSESDALVWIDWHGPRPRTWVFHNGLPVENARLTDRGLHLGGGACVLALDESRVLREGPLIKTALSVIPGIRKWLPMRRLRTRECKWLSRGTLSGQGREASSGWAIHEVVEQIGTGAHSAL